MASKKEINVGVLTLSQQSVVASFLSELGKKNHENTTFRPIFIQLSAEDLDNPKYEIRNEIHVVVLLHSTAEGRLSLTNVPDARYNILLPRLSNLVGE